MYAQHGPSAKVAMAGCHPITLTLQQRDFSSGHDQCAVTGKGKGKRGFV